MAKREFDEIHLQDTSTEEKPNEGLCRLNLLPLELKYMIMRHAGLVDLAALGLASKNFHQLADAFLKDEYAENYTHSVGGSFFGFVGGFYKKSHALQKKFKMKGLEEIAPKKITNPQSRKYLYAIMAGIDRLLIWSRLCSDRNVINIRQSLSHVNYVLGKSSQFSLWFQQNKAGFEKHTVLNLSECFLTHIPDEVSEMIGLTALDLRKNFLRSLPESLSSLCALISLDISFNKFESLPGSLKSIKNLNRLNVSSNPLTSEFLLQLSDELRQEFIFESHDQGLCFSNERLQELLKDLHGIQSYAQRQI